MVVGGQLLHITQTGAWINTQILDSVGDIRVMADCFLTKNGSCRLLFLLGIEFSYNSLTKVYNISYNNILNCNCCLAKITIVFLMLKNTSL